MNTTRNGKIARLPLAVREELNRRLETAKAAGACAGDARRSELRRRRRELNETKLAVVKSSVNQAASNQIKPFNFSPQKPFRFKVRRGTLPHIMRSNVRPRYPARTFKALCIIVHFVKCVAKNPRL